MPNYELVRKIAGENEYPDPTLLGGGTPNNTTFLRGDKTWAAPPGGDGASLPAGCILMWHGLLANIPSGFVLCDGQNGTPDLRSKFVKGAAAGQNPGATGGSATHTHDDHASHTHTYTQVVNHTHTVSVTDPGHNHIITSQTATTGSATSYEHGTLDTSSAEAEATEVTATNTTGITASTANPAGGVATGTTAGPSATLTHSAASSEPAFYAVAFIMKT